MAENYSALDEEIERLRSGIATDQESLMKMTMQREQESEQEVEWFGGLSDAQRTDVFRTSPELYDRMMRRIHARNERNLVGR